MVSALYTSEHWKRCPHTSSTTLSKSTAALRAVVCLGQKTSMFDLGQLDQALEEMPARELYALKTHCCAAISGPSRSEDLDVQPRSAGPTSHPPQAHLLDLRARAEQCMTTVLCTRPSPRHALCTTELKDTLKPTAAPASKL